MKNLFTLLLLLLITCSVSGQSSFVVKKEGVGKPILFLPGFITPGTVWYETIENLERKYQNHIFTYAGFGGVAAIDTPWYPSIKRDIINYIKKEKLSNITIIGHSMGGTLAIDIAAVLPNKVQKIILVDALPAMRALMMPGVSADMIHYNSPYNNQILIQDEKAFRKNAVMMAGGMTADKEKSDTIINWIVRADRKTYVYGYTDLLKLDLREDLKRIKAKTLILGATFPTKEVAKTTFESQYAFLQNKRLEIAPHSKHFIMFDQPEWFYAQVNAFLR
jgi:pimeloyl-ACP methyl ester carboxylesterase